MAASNRRRRLSESSGEGGRSAGSTLVMPLRSERSYNYPAGYRRRGSATVCQQWLDTGATEADPLPFTSERSFNERETLDVPKDAAAGGSRGGLLRAHRLRVDSPSA